MNNDATTMRASDTTKVSASEVAAAFGLAASVAIVFNTILAWTKDAYAPLNSFMASLTGHHWITHGLADVILFFVLGVIFTVIGIPGKGLGRGTIITVAACALLSGAGLGAWFLFF